MSGPEAPGAAAAGRAAVERTARPAMVLGAVLGALTLVRVGYLATGALDLSPDEAHYWEWSRRLDLSYYSKGPLIAYLIAALTTLFGTSAVAIRLGAVLLSVAGAVVLYRLGCRALGDPRPALWAVVGLQLTPLVWAGSLLTTIDAPFLVCWTVALAALYRATVEGRPRAWLAVGVAAGLGFLAKYAMLFLLPGLAVYLWRAPEARARLRHPAALLAAAVALAATAPVLLWNARHDWVSLRHVASQGRGSGFSLLEPLAFVGSQLGVLTPLVAALLAWGVWVGGREGLGRGREPYRFLAAFGLPILAFYGLVSLQGKVQANWPAPAYPSLALLVAGALAERAQRIGPQAARRQARLLQAAAALALTVTAAGHLTEPLGVPASLDPTARLRGWRELGAAVAAQLRTMPRPERTFLLADRYQVASELAFYVPQRPPAYNVNLGRRLNQYDFWEGPERRLGWDAIYVRDGIGELDARLAAAFERTEGPVVVEVRRGGRPVRAFALYRGYGFRGLPAPPGPPTY